MKHILIIITALIMGFSAHAQQTAQPVDKGTLHTVKGVGGWAANRYAFAKGDKVHVHYSANKELDRATAIIGKMDVQARVKGGKAGDMDFTMKDNGVVYLRWVSDRGGVTDIDYEVTRIPESEATLHFDTHVPDNNAAPAE